MIRAVACCSRDFLVPLDQPKSIILAVRPPRGVSRWEADGNAFRWECETRTHSLLFPVRFHDVFSVGAYFVPDLGKLRESIAAREAQTALQGITEPSK